MDYYRILGVSRFANDAQIRQAYWSLSRQIRREHREEHAGVERLAEIEHAFRVLGDSRRRRTYDWQVSRAVRAVRSEEVDEPREDVGRFPAMLAIVPRIRAAFFREPGRSSRTQTQRVELSPRQALEGLRVPVSLHVRPTCPVCGGRGETWAEACGVCVGTGSGSLSQQLRLRVPPGVTHGTRLRFSVTLPYAPETHVELRIAVR